MKKFGASLAILIAASAGAAHAADLPTTKAPQTAPPVNCYASLWTWLNSSAGDCPISYAGVTLYATIDAGVGYESNGAGYNQWWNNGVSNIITKQSTKGPQWLWTPNGLSQSVVGVKVSEPIGYGWSIIGTAETGFNPYGINLAYAQKAQVQNNGKSLFLQTANADSSRTGQPLNSQWFARLQQPGLRHADRRPREHPLARRHQRLRSHGRLLRLLAGRLFRFVRRLRRHRGGARQHRAQVPPRYPELPGWRPGAGRRLQLGQRHATAFTRPRPAATSSSPAAASCRSTGPRASPRTR